MRRSPLHDNLTALRATWGASNDMPVAVSIPGETDDMPLQLADVSCLARMGSKGAQAEQWLVSQGALVPEGVNAWARSTDGMIVARLARSEFLLEDGFGGTRVQQMGSALAPAPGVYPVLRQDAALALAGERVGELLAQVCNVNFRAWPLEQQTVVMTSMVGVSVTVIWYRQNGLPAYRVWCDGTFGPYLWETLLEIARELGGGAVGLKRVFPDAVTQ